VATQTYPSSRVQSERTIAIARIVLAATALLAVWLDPAATTANVRLTFTLYWVYILYSVLLAVAVFTHESGDEVPLITHAVDIIAFSLFQYLTFGPSSPFFLYFVFAMFCGAIRWGWRGTLATGAMVMLSYLALVVSIGPPTPGPGLEMNRFVIRLAYLVVATGMLVYLGLYEARLRTEIERLARWPTALPDDGDAAIGRALEYAARLMEAGDVLVVWETTDEPTIQEARWKGGEVTLHTHPPNGLQMFSDQAVSRSTFICTGPVRQAQSIRLADQNGRLHRRRGMPLHPDMLQRLDGTALATAPIETEMVTGRVFFSDLGPPTEAVPLTEVVAREIGSSLDQVHSARQRQELAAREERIRVARDLHDGVLQALTGVRLELRALATTNGGTPQSMHEQLVSLERALAMEQRELRFFISGLEPETAQRIDRSTLAVRLASVRERLALEWKTPVTLRVAPGIGEVPEPVGQAVPLMVHEAAVNALKHAQASRVAVDVESADGHLRIAVSDDGRGFPFKGYFSHAALAASDVAPRSLFERVAALGGQLSIDSSERGSRVEMVLSL
jgi:signal transduction histidine kinase